MSRSTVIALAGFLAAFAAGLGQAQANGGYTRVNYTTVHETVEFSPALTCAASVIVCPAMPARSDAAG